MTQRLLIIFTFFSTFLFSQTKTDTIHPIDKDMVKCLPKVGTVDRGKCYAKAMESWEKEITKYYNLLLTSKLKQDLKTKLVSSQTSWIAYKDKEFALISDMYYNSSEPELQNIGFSKMTQVLKDRALELKKYSDSKLGQ